jgi:hypothetical protein
MDATQIYREDTFTDRKVGTIRRMTPVTADGADDSARPVLFVGQAQVMTPMGAVPISFELDARRWTAAVEKFGAGRRTGRASNHARTAGNAPRTGLIVGHPRRRGAGLPNPSDLLRAAGDRRAARSLRASLTCRAFPNASRRCRAQAASTCRRCSAGLGPCCVETPWDRRSRPAAELVPLPGAESFRAAAPSSRCSLYDRRRVLAAAANCAQRARLRLGVPPPPFRSRGFALTQPVAVSAHIFVDLTRHPRIPACW